MSWFLNYFPCLKWIKKEELSTTAATTGSEEGSHLLRFNDIEDITDNFRSESVPGQGGPQRLGEVYRGVFNNRVLVITRMHKFEEIHRHFMGEMFRLSSLNHPNIVKLVAICVEREERLLLHEFTPLGSLEARFHGYPRGNKPIDWSTRMNIAVGIARGLQYLHENNIIYRDLRPTNILLGERFQPKLSQFGFAEFEDEDVTINLMRKDDGYCADECIESGKIMTKKSDIYSFGVILLELISGHKAIEYRQINPLNFVRWARIVFEERLKHDFDDPSLQGRYPKKQFLEALRLACSCTQEEADNRPHIDEVVTIVSNIESLSD